MKQEYFKNQSEPGWKEFETLLYELERGKKTKESSSLATFPEMYRKICHDLNIAKANHFDAQLVERLNRLVTRAHQHLYKSGKFSFSRLAAFWTTDFPQAIRRERKLVLFALLLFYGIALGTFALIRFYPELIYTISDRSTVEDIENLYNPTSDHFLKPRGADTDAEMFGYYIYNNISIGFRVFAGGILLGLGSMLIMVFNSLFLGAISAHLFNVGYTTSTFFPFIIAHASLELTAIAFTAAAGFKLGWAIIAPGRFKREHALRLAAYNAIPIVYGSAGMLFTAAMIEGFWSARPIPVPIKFGVGACLWLAVCAYFLFAGRQREN